MVKNQLDPYSPEGCFIATAVYGDSYKLNTLREFRDFFLNTSNAGKKLVKIYYENSPSVADYIRQKEILKLFIRIVLIDPVYCLAKALLKIRKILK